MSEFTWGLFHDLTGHEKMRPSSWLADDTTINYEQLDEYLDGSEENSLCFITIFMVLIF